MLRLRRLEALMLDGTIAMTEMILKEERRDECIDMLLQQMCEHGDMVVGFDLVLCFQQSDISLLTLCTQFGCLLIRLYGGAFVLDNFGKLGLFHSHKDIIFAGVRIQRDVKRLREKYGLEIRNVVDLRDLAADVLHQSRLRAFGVRGLAHEVLLVPFKTRSSRVILVDYWTRDAFSQEQIECASTDAYAAYKIGKKLLGA